MADVRGAGRAFARLMIVQASWTYERLQGVGIGFASLPLLRALETDSVRHRAAVGRASELFNAHPYLDGIAVGAAARAELDGVSGGTVQRLKTALAGPLGALGDQLFWIGLVPAVMGAALIGVAFGAGLWAVGVGFGWYLVCRLGVTLWGLRLGLRSGLGISTALKTSGLADLVRRVGLLAGLVVGAAVPVVGAWFGRDIGRTGVMLAMVLGAAGGVLAAGVKVRVPTSRRLMLIAMALVLLWWGIR